MALLGTAFVRVRPDTRGFQQEAQSSLGGGLKKIAGAVTAAFAAVKVGGFLKDAVTEASDYGETLSKSANVFGQKLAPAIQQFAATAPKAFGISETAALAATAQFGNMFIQLGFTGDAAAKASTNLIKTAADLGSFNNVDPSDVLERIGASLRGEFDSLQQLIPNINAARVEKEALAATGKTLAKQLTAEEKATATLAIIQKDGVLAANDFAETSGGLANQQRILSATVDGLQRRLGQALLPTVTKVVTFLNANAEPAFNKVAAAVELFIGAFRNPEKVAQLGNSLGPVATAGARVREVFDNAKVALGDFFDRVKGGDFSSVGRDLSSAGDSAKTLAPVVKDLAASVPSFSDALSVTSTVLRTAADHTDTLAKLVPALAAGFILFKVAQLASNIAAVTSIPLRIAEIAAQRALTKSIAAQTVALGVNTAASSAAKVATVGSTVATTADTTATNAGALARARATVATVASTVAQKAAAIATKAYAAAQVLLNVALTANPIGLVIAALVALGAGIVLAYQKSETFRDIVNGALNAVKTAFVDLATAALGVVSKILGGYQALAEAAGRLPGPLGAPFRAAAEAIGGAKAKVDALRTGIGALTGKNVKVTAATSGAVRDINSVGAAAARLRDKTIVVTTVQRTVTEGQRKVGKGSVPGFASGVRNFSGGLALVGERGPELVQLPRGSDVFSNSESKQIAGASNTYNLHVTGPVDPVTTFALFKRMEMLYA